MNELDQLELEAQAIDAEAAQNEFTQQEAAPLPSLNASFKPVILKFLGFTVGLVNTRIPFANQHFNQSANESIADSIINVADIEGIDLQSILGDPNSRFGAWVSLALAVGLPSFTLYMAVQDYKKANQKEAEKEVKPASNDANTNPISENLAAYASQQ